ncbi:DUF4214 domain-containing protein [Sulfuricurvum sp.]|uniref:DUF4214 domain-containing protein n=2 Tax=Sulfuricurvum sp. TaxID=2025608 RepID=UPI003452980D
MVMANMTAFIESLYEKILFRVSDASGLLYWTDKLENGELSITEITSDFVNSQEFAVNIAPIENLYFAAFGRAPDMNGLEYWINENKTGISLEKIASFFIESSEYTSLATANMTNEDFIESLYVNGLGRESDALGKAYWVHTMVNGATKANILASFSNSAEAYLKNGGDAKIIALHIAFTHEEATNAELSSNAPLNEIINSLYNSTEYKGVDVPGATGIVSDGYISGAAVFADANGDGVWNEGEVKTTTDANGDYTLVGASGSIVAFGGIDIATGIAFKGIFTAPEGSTTVSPLTTLIDQVMKAIYSTTGVPMTAAGATAKVAEALGLDSSIDLLTFDPIKAASDATLSAQSQAAAVAVQLAAMQVANMISQSASMLSGAGITTEASGTISAADALAAMIVESSTGSIDLSSSQTIKIFLEGSATKAGATAQQVAAVATVSQAIALATANINTVMETVVTEAAVGVSFAEIFTQLAKIQTVANDISILVKTAAATENALSVVAASDIAAITSAAGINPIDTVEPTLPPSSHINNAPTVTEALISATDEDQVTYSIDLLQGANDSDKGAILRVIDLVEQDSKIGWSVIGNSITINPSAYNTLAAGETETLNLNYQIRDEQRAVVNQTLTVTIEGRNDAPVVEAVLTSSINEDHTAYVIDLLQGVSDIDHTAVLNAVNIVETNNNVKGWSIDGNTIVTDPNTYDMLAQGETQKLEFTYQVQDEHGATVDQSLTIDIAGINDAPTVTSPLTSTTDEDQLSYVINLLQGTSDVDHTAVLNVVNIVEINNNAAGWSIDGNTIVIDPSVYDSMKAGEAQKLEFIYTIEDEFGAAVDQSLTVDIAGKNEAPSLSVETLAGDKVNEVKLYIVSSPLLDERVELRFDNLDPDARVYDGIGNDVTNGIADFYANALYQGDHVFTVVMNGDVLTPVDVTVAGYNSDGTLNAEKVQSTELYYDINETSQAVAFINHDQNMWADTMFGADARTSVFEWHEYLPVLGNDFLQWKNGEVITNENGTQAWQPGAWCIANEGIELWESGKFNLVDVSLDTTGATNAMISYADSLLDEADKLLISTVATVDENIDQAVLAAYKASMELINDAWTVYQNFSTKVDQTVQQAWVKAQNDWYTADKVVYGGATSVYNAALSTWNSVQNWWNGLSTIEKVFAAGAYGAAQVAWWTAEGVYAVATDIHNGALGLFNAAKSTYDTAVKEVRDAEYAIYKAVVDGEAAALDAYFTAKNALLALAEDAYNDVKGVVDDILNGVADTGASGTLKVDGELFGRIGVQVDFIADGGSVDTDVKYTFSSTTQYNKTSDILVITPTLVNVTDGTEVAFSTQSPHVSIAAKLLYDVGAQLYFDIDGQMYLMGDPIFDLGGSEGGISFSTVLSTGGSNIKFVKNSDGIYIPQFVDATGITYTPTLVENEDGTFSLQLPSSLIPYSEMFEGMTLPELFAPGELPIFSFDSSTVTVSALGKEFDLDGKLSDVLTDKFDQLTDGVIEEFTVALPYLESEGTYVSMDQLLAAYKESPEYAYRWLAGEVSRLAGGEGYDVSSMSFGELINEYYYDEMLKTFNIDQIVTTVENATITLGKEIMQLIDPEFLKEQLGLASQLPVAKNMADIGSLLEGTISNINTKLLDFDAIENQLGIDLGLDMSGILSDLSSLQTKLASVSDMGKELSGLGGYLDTSSTDTGNTGTGDTGNPVKWDPDNGTYYRVNDAGESVVLYSLSYVPQIGKYYIQDPNTNTYYWIDPETGCLVPVVPSDPVFYDLGITEPVLWDSNIGYYYEKTSSFLWSNMTETVVVNPLGYDSSIGYFVTDFSTGERVMVDVETGLPLPADPIFPIWSIDRGYYIETLGDTYVPFSFSQETGITLNPILIDSVTELKYIVDSGGNHVIVTDLLTGGLGDNVPTLYDPAIDRSAIHWQSSMYVESGYYMYDGTLLNALLQDSDTGDYYILDYFTQQPIIVDPGTGLPLKASDFEVMYNSAYDYYFIVDPDTGYPVITDASGHPLAESPVDITAVTGTPGTFEYAISSLTGILKSQYDDFITTLKEDVQATYDPEFATVILSNINYLTTQNALNGNNGILDIDTLIAMCQNNTMFSYSDFLFGTSLISQLPADIPDLKEFMLSHLDTFNANTAGLNSYLIELINLNHGLSSLASDLNNYNTYTNAMQAYMDILDSGAGLADIIANITQNFAQNFTDLMKEFLDREYDTDPFILVDLTNGESDGLFHINTLNFNSDDIINDPLNPDSWPLPFLPYTDPDISDNTASFGFYVAGGETDPVFKMTIDVDMLVSEIIIKVLNALGIEIQYDGNSPFETTIGVDQILTFASVDEETSTLIKKFFDASLHVDKMDYDVSASADISQDFTLTVDDMTYLLTFTETGSESTDPATMSFKASEYDSFTIEDASQYDVNKDGTIEYDLQIVPTAMFSNDTELGYNYGLNLDFLQTTLKSAIQVPLADLLGIPKLPTISINLADYDIGPLLAIQAEINALDIDIWESRFAMDIGNVSLEDNSIDINLVGVNNIDTGSIQSA